MAEEAAEEGGGGDGGSALKKYGPLAAIVLLAQVVLAWVVIQFTLKDNVPDQAPEQLIPEQANVEIRQGQEEAKSRLPYLYVSEDLNQITANPAGTNSERFVVLGVQLGLEAYNRDEAPPDDDITSDLGENALVLDKIALYDLKVKSTIVNILRGKTVDELDAPFIHEVQDQIRKTLNKEIFERLFKVDDENKIEVRVVEVNVSDLVIQ
ncbi:MAG: flagellar basal body-associated FliL family protein [Candidatus Latescibacterota bacterium]|jgi:flagellar basal body-associated protein FliL